MFWFVNCRRHRIHVDRGKYSTFTFVCVVVNFFSGSFYFSFVSTSLVYIAVPKHMYKRKTKIIWDKKLTTTYALTSYYYYYYYYYYFHHHHHYFSLYLNSYIFRTADCCPRPKIETARLDGTDRKILVVDGIQSPSGLTIDKQDKKIYWAGIDANKYGIIEVISLDDLSRTVIFHRPDYQPFSLDVFEDYVYWSDLGKNAVLRINKSNGNGEEVIMAGLKEPKGLKILHKHEDIPGRITNSYKKQGTIAHVGSSSPHSFSSYILPIIIINKILILFYYYY